MTYPHCDSRILHAPGVCDLCDRHPRDQDARIRAKINFTGEHDPEKSPCPADAERGAESYNRWGGNVPHKGRVVGIDWAGYEVTEADPRLKEEEE